MCIAILRLENQEISKPVLETCFSNNPDGAGYAYSLNGVLTIKKGFFTFESFWDSYKDIPLEAVSLIHFRIGTSGELNEENCHPWSITEDICMIHNGVISDFSRKDSKISDTGLFVDEILAPIINKYGIDTLKEPALQYLLVTALGSSKVITLDKFGIPIIFNEKAGNWVNGVWFSNDSYKEDKKKNKTQPNSSSNDWGTKTHIVFRKNKKHGVVRKGFGIDLLTDREVRALKSEYRCKIKKLIKNGILQLVELGNDDRVRYELAQRKQAILNGTIKVQELENEHYCG